MLAFRGLSPLPSTRIPSAINRSVPSLMVLIILGAIYRYCWVDAVDHFRCRALLNQGEWLDPCTEWHPRKPQRSYQNWQPPGCLMHEYKREDIAICFGKKRLIFIGDSTIRQMYWAVATKLDQKKAANDMQDLLRQAEKHKNPKFISAGVTVEFIWDPWLNSTELKHELESFKSYPASGVPVKSEESAGVILLGAPGLWHARYGGKTFYKEFKEAIDKVVPYLGRAGGVEATPLMMPISAQESMTNLPLIAPVQVPCYELLSPSRRATITPAKIDQMNNYLHGISASSKADILWSYWLMTSNINNVYQESGLHVADNVADRKADVLLNLRCNADAAQIGFPYNRTCCSNYKRPGGAQQIIIITTMLILPFLFFGRRKYCADLNFPSLKILRAVKVISGALCFSYLADRTQVFEKAHKHFQKSEFVTALAALGVAGILTFRKSHGSQVSTRSSIEIFDIEFLSRDQTEEWKGWMQFFILVYHYTQGSKTLEIYEIVRLLVASYLFMTGYGHTLYLLRNEDYSVSRLAKILIRLNLLPAGMTYMMRTNYLFYYFPPLVSFWFLIIYCVLRAGCSLNSNPYFLISKIIFAAVTTTLITVVPGILEFVFLTANYAFRVSWDVNEWRFRLHLDMFIVYVGMIVAIFCHRTSQIRSGSLPVRTLIDRTLRLAVAYNTVFKAFFLVLISVPLLVFWALTRRASTKEDYNQWLPYISFAPILFFVALRNSHRHLCNHYSTLFAWLGRISLETYVLQYHIWMAGDTSGLLRIGLWNRGIEAAFITPVFLWISWRVADATRVLTTWIVDGVAEGVNGNDGALQGADGKDDALYLLPRDEPVLNSSAGMAKDGRTDTARGYRGVWRRGLKWRLGLIFALIWVGNVTYW